MLEPSFPTGSEPVKYDRWIYLRDVTLFCKELMITYVNFISLLSQKRFFPECGQNCHFKCQKFMPNLCGINQKLLSEALSNVKVGRISNPKQGKPAQKGNAKDKVRVALQMVYILLIVIGNRFVIV